MDIRVEKTERAIKQAFMELRAQRPVEKIRVKELCDLARINKSTFYAHYQDIYALAGALEDELVETVLDGLSQLRASDFCDRTEWLTQELFRAFGENKREVTILFSDTRQSLFINRLEQSLRERVEKTDPGFWNDPVRRILLSFCVQGSYYAFANNSGQVDDKRLVQLLAAIARAAQNADPARA
ncbi:MAG: TetR/AcrR family transcriptional regulator [Faecalibacterium sp.]